MKIPSVVNMCGVRVHVNYQGQPKTCFKCGKAGHLGASSTEIKVNEPKFPGKWEKNKRIENPIILDPKYFPTLSNTTEINSQKVDKEKTKPKRPPTSPKPMSEIATVDNSSEKTADGNFAEIIEKPNSFFKIRDGKL